MSLKPCITCGAPVDSTRCEDCTPVHKRETQKIPMTSAASRGYDWRWTQLSRRARRAQPFCSDCGTDRDLQADHSPEAWRRYEAGLPIRLRDVTVLCAPCNVARGSSRPGGKGSPRTRPTPSGQPQRLLRMLLNRGEAS